MISSSLISLLPGRLLVSHYLLASYCYYWQNCSPMMDHAFDQLCVRLLKEYDDIEHEHKHLVEKEALTAGTCLLSHESYPSRVIHGWRDYIAAALNGHLEEDLRQRYGEVKRARVTRVSRTPKPTEEAAGTRRVRRVRASVEPEETPPTRRKRTVRVIRSR